MNKKIAIHETAFVTSVFRAGNVALSKDSYAHLWPNPKTDEHALRYTRAVSEYEPFAHCLRNRYFYEKIGELAASGAIEYLINFGCGFSMYPFLFNSGLKHIEIDQADVIDLKSEKIHEWQLLGILPEREITYIASDFNNEFLSDLRSEILAVKRERASFILIEGVLFFIGKNTTDRLFKLFSDLQRPNEFIGSVSFQPALEKAEVFGKLVSFVEENLDKNLQFNYQTLDDRYYENLKSYQLLDQQDTLSMGRTFAPNMFIEPGEVLNEHVYLLKKLV